MKKYFSTLIAVLFASQLFALEPPQILIIANANVNESVQLAEYYCKKRAVPLTNILKIPLGKTLSEQINRKA